LLLVEDFFFLGFADAEEEDGVSRSLLPREEELALELSKSAADDSDDSDEDVESRLLDLALLFFPLADFLASALTTRDV
jgi:hypothetical protein